jgi:hypothetical protein
MSAAEISLSDTPLPSLANAATPEYDQIAVASAAVGMPRRSATHAIGSGVSASRSPSKRVTVAAGTAIVVASIAQPSQPVPATAIRTARHAAFARGAQPVSTRIDGVIARMPMASPTK